MIENVPETTEATEDDVAEIDTLAPHIPWKQHKPEAPDTGKHRWQQHKAPKRTLVEKLLGK